MSVLNRHPPQPNLLLSKSRNKRRRVTLRLYSSRLQLSRSLRHFSSAGFRRAPPPRPILSPPAPPTYHHPSKSHSQWRLAEARRRRPSFSHGEKKGKKKKIKSPPPPHAHTAKLALVFTRHQTMAGYWQLNSVLRGDPWHWSNGITAG